MTLLINILLGIYVFVALLMMLIILMQRPKSEGLGAAFGGGVTENIFGAQTTNVLTKITGWLAAIFFLLTFFLSILYARKANRPSNLSQEVTAGTTPIPAASATPIPGASLSPGPATSPGGASATVAASPAAGASTTPAATVTSSVPAATSPKPSTAASVAPATSPVSSPPASAAPATSPKPPATSPKP
jgi:preprotein translocase subunit SecG